MAKQKDDALAEVNIVDTTVDTPVEDVIALTDYLKEVAVNEYLVASFRYEGTYNDISLLEPKSRDGWKRAIQAQSNKVYE